MPVVPDLEDLRVDLNDLTPYHRNPRKGDVDTLVESLQAHGQYRPIVVNKGTKTGRPNEIAAGNHTWHAAKRLRWKKLAATWIDVDEDTLSRIVLVDNRASDLGQYHDRELAQMLEDLRVSDDVLAGTGWSEMDAHHLLQRIGEPEKAVEFLDQFTGTVDKEETIISSGGQELVKLQFLLTAAERHTLRTALDLAKTIIGSTVSSDALVHIATDWMADDD